jgi:uncharacterized membrane protein
MPSLKTFITEQDRQKIADIIQEVESKTSGEIRVYFEKHCKNDVLQRALELFHKLKMQDTKDRTGILFYVAYEDRKFAVVGDEGIHAKVPEQFWEAVKDAMETDFKNGEFAKGIVVGITMSKTYLEKHFPRMKDDTNELPDDIIVSDK